MKWFKKITQCFDHVERGGQALHVYPAMPKSFPNAPNCFKRAKLWAHLMDNNEERLIRTARELGVKVIKVSKRGERGQHIDLCGVPLERAMTRAKKVTKRFVKEDKHMKFRKGDEVRRGDRHGKILRILNNGRMAYVKWDSVVKADSKGKVGKENTRRKELILIGDLSPDKKKKEDKK